MCEALEELMKDEVRSPVAKRQGNRSKDWPENGKTSG